VVPPPHLVVVVVVVVVAVDVASAVADHMAQTPTNVHVHVHVARVQHVHVHGCTAFVVAVQQSHQNRQTWHLPYWTHSDSPCSAYCSSWPD